ncbi:MAG: hypothetical protein FWG02_10675, partial [Holophagaceae bacterium]|nr:hypothetical protein [Holophagaceae bacterium]
AVQLFVVELLCQDLFANHGRLLFIGGLGSPSMNNKNVNSYKATRLKIVAMLRRKTEGFHYDIR